MIHADLSALFDGLKLAAREIGGVQIQNRGTLAGNICTASPAGDGAPNLLFAGYTPRFAGSLRQIRFDARRIGRVVKKRFANA